MSIAKAKGLIRLRFSVWGFYTFLSFKIALIVLLARHCKLKLTSCALVTLLFATIRFTHLLIPSMCMRIQTLIFC